MEDADGDEADRPENDPLPRPSSDARPQWLLACARLCGLLKILLPSKMIYNVQISPLGKTVLGMTQLLLAFVQQ